MLSKTKNVAWVAIVTLALVLYLAYNQYKTNQNA